MGSDDLYYSAPTRSLHLCQRISKYLLGNGRPRLCQDKGVKEELGAK